MAELLGGDVGDQVVVGPGRIFVAATEVEGLEGVVHEGRHLAELAAEQFLDDGGGIGIRPLGLRKAGRDPVIASDQE
jgi:hypothetical protein